MSAMEAVSPGRWPQIPREHLRDWFNNLGAARANGVKCVDLNLEEAVCVMNPPADFLNRNGSVNGAALAALSDLSCGVLIAHLCEPGEYPATLELSIRYLRAAKHLPLTARSRQLRRRAADHGWPAVEIRDSRGELCCVASGTWSIMVRPELGGGRTG
jgi:uncharacterized protein (TIGR00369 family)